MIQSQEVKKKQQLCLKEIFFKVWYKYKNKNCIKIWNKYKKQHHEEKKQQFSLIEFFFSNYCKIWQNYKKKQQQNLKQVKEKTATKLETSKRKNC